MLRLLLLLTISSLSTPIIQQENPQEPQGEVPSTPMQMARLKKKGSRNDGACTDEGLRKIMHEQITDNMADSKRAIHRAVTGAFDGSYGVLCAECVFSYIIHTHEYCTFTKNDITCLVYKDG